MYRSNIQKGEQMSVLNVTKKNFYNDVLQSELPVLIEFWSPLYEPCQILTLIFEKISEEYPTLRVCKINADEEKELARSFSIVSIPTICVVKQGSLTKQIVGVRDKNEIVSLILD